MENKSNSNSLSIIIIVLLVILIGIGGVLVYNSQNSFFLSASTILAGALFT